MSVGFWVLEEILRFIWLARIWLAEVVRFWSIITIEMFFFFFFVILFFLMSYIFLKVGVYERLQKLNEKPRKSF